MLSRSACLKHARQGSADVSYNGRGRLHRVLRGGLVCRLVCSRSGVNGRLSLVQYYLRKGWAGCQLEVVLHSVLWGIAGTTGGGPAAEIIMVIYGCIAVCMCQQTAVAVVVVVVVVAGACNKGG